MTTYELPPEPPISSRVRDARGFEWERRESGWNPVGGHPGNHKWSWILSHGPATLIEPDPWPTADYVWGTVESDGGESDGPTLWLRRPSGAYESVESYADSRSNRFTLVVPVTVVPTAEWEAMAKSRPRGSASSHSEWVERLAALAIALVDATDALGVDQ